MTFWDKVKSAGNAAAQAAQDAAVAAKKAVEDLRSYPTAVMCSACQTTVPVPANLWDWTCAKADCAKTNTGAAAVCVDCKTAKPKTPNPKVTCGKCGTLAIVPTSNAGRLLDDGKTVVVQTGKSAKKEFEMLQEKPSQFHCEHCQTLLGVPGPTQWTCTAPNCKTVNPPDSAACAGCAAAKPATANMVLCGVCNKATKVPSTNFMVKLKAEYAAAEKGVKKLYFDVASKPYILCPRCQTPLHVDLKKQAAAAGAAGAAPAAAGGEDSKAKSASAATASASASGAGVEGQPSSAGGEAVGGKASAGQSSVVPPPAAPAEPPGVEIVCSKCSERLLVAVGAGNGGAGAGAAGADAGAAAAPAPAPASAAGAASP